MTRFEQMDQLLKKYYHMAKKILIIYIKKILVDQ